MDHAKHQPTTSSATQAPPPPPPPMLSSTEPERPVSQSSASSRQEYLDSLVVPSNEEFAHIADVQAEREAEQKRRQREQKRQSLDAAPHPSDHDADRGSRHALSSRFGFGRHANASDDGLRAKAATVIQRTYRGYRVRREMKGLAIDASTRWVHAVREAQWRDMITPRARSALTGEGSPSPQPGSRSSTARQNWKKVSVIARHAGNDVDADSTSVSSSSSSSSSDSDSESGEHKTDEQRKLERKRKEEAKATRKQAAKMMGLQYFLEMVDLKHRYGSNLRVYHEEWKRADTNENFFYWLDYGAGKDVDVAACPRERLDREQVRYLSREERQYYLVKIDGDGRLCWAKNGARIDTSVKYKDSIHGIVPSDDPTPEYAPVSENQTALLGDSSTESDASSRSSSSSASSVRSGRYRDASRSSGKKLSHHLSGATILDKLLRKTVRKNTWIFVADTSFRLYVGIKNSGAFQHSSFLQGSRISAAGLIRIRDGRLTSLSPLSGHYRPPTSNFRAFVGSLRDAGADMHHVSVSKSYAVLLGLEMYVRARKKAKDVVGKVRRHGRRAPGEEDVLVVPSERKASSAAGEEEVVGGEEKKTATGSTAGAHTPGHLSAVPEDAGQEEQAHDGQQQPRLTKEKEKEEEKMREENSIAVEVMQKLDLGTGLPEPKGQKGG